MRNRIYTFAIALTVIALIVGFTYGQQPKPEAPKPQTYILNPDASKVWANIDAAEAELRRQFDQLENQRATLLIGAGVPADSRSCKADDKGVVICSKKVETASTSPSP